MLSGIFYVKLETPLERAEEVNQYLGIMDFDNIKSIILVTLVKFSRVLYGQQAKYYEAEQVPVLKHTKPGLLSMVNVGDNMYICLVMLQHLNIH